MSNEFKPHAILVGVGTLVAVCLTKNIAEDYAKAYYKPGTYRVAPATRRDLNTLIEQV